MRHQRALLALASACLLSWGCTSEGVLNPPRELLAVTPTRVEVDGRALTMEAELWRDFEPITPPGGRPLAAVVHVTTADGSSLPRGVTADRVSVLYQDQVWTARVRQEDRREEANVLEVVVREGPKWGPDVNVDVVLRLRGAAGEEYLLRATDQTIRRVD
jgi:hypothetical protein